MDFGTKASVRHMEIIIGSYCFLPLILLNQVKVSVGHQNCIDIVDFRVAYTSRQHSYMSAISPFLCLL